MTTPFHIRTKTLKDGRTSYYCDCHHHGQRYRAWLGHDTHYTVEQIHERAWEFWNSLKNPQKAEQREHVARRGGPEHMRLSDLMPMYFDEFDLKNRIDHKRPQMIYENHFVRIFGRKKLKDFSYADGIKYQTVRKEEGASLGTLEREWGFLMRLLNLAEKLDWIDKNRLKACPKPKGVRRKRVASTDELLALQTVAGEQLWRFLLVGLNTGLRLGNTFRIESEWIMEGHWLHIPAPRSPLKNHPNKIPLNVLAVDAITGGITKLSSGRVWNWQNIHSIEKVWRHACKRAGVVDLNLHDLRHTFATRLQNLGVGYEVRQALLGHRMPGMTHSYSHGGKQWETQLREAVTALDVDYRKDGIVARDRQPLDETRRVVNLDSYKSLKNMVSRPRLERGTHALKGHRERSKNNDVENSHPVCPTPENNNLGSDRHPGDGE